MGITFLPSIVNDASASELQLQSESSCHSDMQATFRISAENMYDAGLIYSGMI